VSSRVRDAEAAVTVETAIKTDNGLTATLARQRAAFLSDGPPPLAQRRGDLIKLKDALWKHREDFVGAINADFGHRSRQETLNASAPRGPIHQPRWRAVSDTSVLA
jgi:hypothetical protein